MSRRENLFRRETFKVPLGRHTRSIRAIFHEHNCHRSVFIVRSLIFKIILMRGLKCESQRRKDGRNIPCFQS